MSTTYLHPPPRHVQSLTTWLVGQLLQFFKFASLLIGVGVVIAMIKRQFSWRAVLVGLGTMLFGIGVLVAVLTLDPWELAGRRSTILWTGCLLLATFSGFLMGRVGHKVGFWESYFVIFIVAVVTFIHLVKGWDSILGIFQNPMDTWGLPTRSPGEVYFGPLWDRVFFLCTGAAFILSVFGGSIAFIFFSHTGRFEPNFRVEWFISRRHLSREGHGIISVTALVAVVGIGLGVAALVAVTAVMSGYQEDIQDKILQTNAHLVVQKYGIDFTEYPTITQKALAVDGVLAATPFTFHEAMLSDGERGLGVLIKGIDPQTAPAVTGLENNLCQPDEGTDRCVRYTELAASSQKERHRGLEVLQTQDGVPGILLGAELFKRLGLPMGSPILLTTPIGMAGARGNAPRRMEFRIVGAFRSGMHEFDARLAYLELGASQHLLGMGKAVNGVEFRVQDPNTVDVVAARVLRAIGRYPYKTLDWRELNHGIFMALNLQKAAMFLILAFIVVVAAFNIASTLFMAVVERAREIAVLKSMGASDASIMKVFVTQGWVLGGLGTLFGLLLGLFVCFIISRIGISIAADVYMVESLKVRVWPLELLLTIVATFVISHLATIYPAQNAASQRPVDAMRYE